MSRAVDDATTRVRLVLTGLLVVALASLVPSLAAAAGDAQTTVTLAVVALALAAIARLATGSGALAAGTVGRGARDRAGSATGAAQTSHRPRAPPAPTARSWVGLTLACASQRPDHPLPHPRSTPMSVLAPLSYALAAVVAAAHACLTSLGADPASGTTWLLCIAAVVVVVRIALLPLAVHGVRLAHASARARPQLSDLTQRYRNRRDPESLRAFADERRRIASEHGMSRLGFLPVLVQIPIWLALYHLLADVAGGASVGAMSPELVASLGAATLLGVPLAERGYLGSGMDPSGGGRRARVHGGGARLRHPEVPGRAEHRPEPTCPRPWSRAHQLMPVLSARGRGVAGGVVPVALLVYWVCNATWTLGQSAVVVAMVPHTGVPGRRPRPRRQ